MAAAGCGIDPVLCYPPVDPGLPVCSVQDIVAAQSGLVALLRRIVSTDDTRFDENYLEPVRQLARWIHLLPASSHEEFAGPGGLFRQCLEVAVYSAQAADGRIFTPTEDVQTRHAMEPRWKYAAFLAGLVCCVCRPLSCCVVVCEQGGVWPKHSVPLADWLTQVGGRRYFVQWAGSCQVLPSGAEGAPVVGQVLPQRRLSWLDEGSPAVVRDVMALAYGQCRPGDSILGETVLRIRDEVLRRDELTRRSRYGRLSIGSHLEPYLLDAVREMVHSGCWVPNDGGPLLYGTDGLYLEWPTAFDAIRAMLLEIGLAGVPRSALTVAELLGRAGALLPDGSGQWLWTVVSHMPTRAADLPSAPRRTALRFREAGAALGLVQARALPRPFALSLVHSLLEAENTAQTMAAASGTPPLSPTGSMPDSAAHDGVPGIPGSTPAPAAGAPLYSSSAAGSPGVGSLGTAAVPPPGRPQSHAVHLPEPVRRQLKAADAELLGRWLQSFRLGRTHEVCEHDGRQIAVSRESIEALDLDFSRVVEMLERHQWLGRADEGARGARVADIQFADRRKPGLVISAQAAQALGFRAGKV